jgi:hypothetical protein
MKSVAVFLLAAGVLLAMPVSANDTTKIKHKPSADVTLKLPEGFNAVTISESLGKNRHIAVNTNGDIYVKVERLKDGKGIIVLRESDGKAAVVNSFGDFKGSGIAIKDGYLYATTDEEVYRFSRKRS